MQQSIPARIQGVTLSALSLALLGLSGCSAQSDVDEEDLASTSEALGTCSSQNLTIAAATASSVQQTFVAAKAIDHNQATRWSSGQGAPQWLRLDLGSRAFISSLTIDWETAFSPDYEIQVSDNATNWAPIRRIQSATGGHHEITGLNVDARYIRIFAKQMSPYNSVSIFEVSVAGTANPACSATPLVCGDSVRLPPVATSASSQEFSYTPASAGADDVYSTRWSSQYSNNQWLALDLGAPARIDQARITWETAYATSYAFETASSMAGPWSQVKLISNGQGGVETVSLGNTSRFLRLKGITRATNYGYSIWDLTVFGSLDSACEGGDTIDELITACPSAAVLDSIDADFDIRFEFNGDDPAGSALVCTAAAGSRNLTHSQERIYQALIAIRALQFNQPLPFTNLPVYDWMAQSIEGIRVIEDAPGSSCCAPPPGETGAYVTIQVDANRTWLASDLWSMTWGGGMFDLVQLLVHETRHANGPLHTCGGNDNTIAEAGAWAAVYHFARAVAFNSNPCFIRPFYDASAGYPDPVLNEDGYLAVARDYAYSVQTGRFCNEPTDPPVPPEAVTGCPD